MPKMLFLARGLSLLPVPLTAPDPSQAVGTGFPQFLPNDSSLYGLMILLRRCKGQRVIMK